MWLSRPGLGGNKGPLIAKIGFFIDLDVVAGLGHHPLADGRKAAIVARKTCSPVGMGCREFVLT
jgi:hypothetical protein